MSVEHYIRNQMTLPKTKSVFITGASSDIGLALVSLYLRNEYRIIAHCSRGCEKLQEVLSVSPDSVSIQGDFSKVELLEGFLVDNATLIKSCDVFINAAALLESIPFDEVTGDDFIRFLMVNTISGIMIARLVAHEMARRGGGRIVHLSSVGVKYGGGANSFCYSFSKHALEFFPSVIKLWAKDNVYVNILRVGLTDTKIHRNDPSKDMGRRISLIPAGRMATPAEMAQAIYWLGSENNTYMTGQVIANAGGE